MVNDIHLFIGGKEVEFSSTPQILYNYVLKDATNPTIVRNSFSKSLDIPFTPTNDDIFNHFWNLQRQQSTDLPFNPIKKVPFELYYNGALIEKGYVKLDKVKQANHNGTYSVTLYGGIGSFFYNLAYSEGAMGDSKKNMASLQYVTNYDDEPELDFRINKDEVYEAWQGITGYGVYNERYDVINFAPCYNGVPSDFDANKVLINYSGKTNDIFASAITDNGVTYRPFLNNSSNGAGYALGESQSDLTEWETFDLRSYLQRPVLNVKRALEACFHPSNNGGYQVKLDNTFFHNDNPYWVDSWVTLPMLRDLEITQGESETITGATITFSGTTGSYPMTAGSTMNLFKVNMTTPANLTRLNNASITIQPKFTPSGSAGASTLYASKRMYIDTGLHLFDANRWVRWFYGDNGVIIQLEALNGNTIVAVSDAYMLGGFEQNTGDDTSLWKKFEGGGTYRTHFIQGKWVKSGSAYYFTSMNGNRKAISFNLNTDADYNTLRLRVMFPETYYALFSPWGRRSVYDNPVTQNVNCELFTDTYFNISGDYTFSQARSYGTVQGKYSFDVVEMAVEMVDYDSLFSNTLIPKNKLLATSYTPADFLLAYAKMFGLYFYIDPAEPSDDASKYPSGVVHILTRGTYYDDAHIEITDRIDRSQNMDIQPTMIEKKWVEFNQEQNDSQVANSYKENYGHQYGRQLVNTNYQFNAETLKAFDSTVFKGGVMVTEKSKYYYQPIQGVPYYIWNGFSYSLFNGENNLETEIPVTRLSVKDNLNTLGLDGYDAFAKLQCHTADNSPADGSGVLLFYKGGYNVSGRTAYWITDDVQDMVYLNDGTPCWILTNCTHNGAGSEIAKKITYMPLFTRDLINFGWEEGNIVNSFNFGHPQVTYVPNTYTTDGDSIYDKCWKNYIRDLYDENTKMVTCYVRLPQVPHPSFLRHWWHFDGGIWALNEIKDWNPLQDKPILCSFIKVQDVDNYSSDTITKGGYKSLVLDKYSVSPFGDTITGTIYLQSGGQWFTGQDESDGRITGRDEFGNTFSYQYRISPLQGSGTYSQISISIPQNPSSGNTEWEIAIWDDNDNAMRAYVQQAAMASGSLTFTDAPYRIGDSATTFTAHYAAVNMNPQVPIQPYLYDASGNTPNWLSAVVDESTSTVAISATANSGSTQRRAYIRIWGNDYEGNLQQATASITQSATTVSGSISWNSDALNVASGSTTTTLGYTYSNIQTNQGTWVVAFDDDMITTPSWVTISNNSGTSTATFTIEANTGNTARHTNIQVNAFGLNGVSINDRIVLTQARNSANLSVYPLSREWLFAQSALPQIIGVTGDTSYSATTNNNNFVISPTGGTGVTDIICHPASANSAYYDLVTTVTITDGDNTFNATLTQGAAPHTVPSLQSDYNVWDAPSAGYTTGFTFEPILPAQYFFVFSGQTEWCYFTKASDGTKVGTGAYWTDDYKNTPAPWFNIVIEPYSGTVGVRSATMWIKTFVTDVSDTYLVSTYAISVEQWE